MINDHLAAVNLLHSLCMFMWFSLLPSVPSCSSSPWALSPPRLADSIPSLREIGNILSWKGPTEPSLDGICLLQPEMLH